MVTKIALWSVAATLLATPTPALAEPTTPIAEQYATTAPEPNPTTTATEAYAALGDSAASGNGTRRSDLSSSCYRSSRAYAPMIAAERPNTTLAFLACQGAETPDIVTTQAPNLTPTTRWVTVSIGGNDIGFGDLILNCTSRWDEPTCLATVDQVNTRIRDELGPKLDRAYAAIRTHAPTATVLTIGYPRFYGPNTTCPDADGATPTEATALNGVADNLDTKIADRSRAAASRTSASSTPSPPTTCAPKSPTSTAKWN
ncbi:SGNH/GDSL hydrolase family protein [Actinokineospora soli]|uniref:SGNH/GDSL hydrolase family protein n=1 Tax=Actinokineospora soli TaxID=1048753 RepID=A0ABW2TWM2_9PSEU